MPATVLARPHLKRTLELWTATMGNYAVIIGDWEA